MSSIEDVKKIVSKLDLVAPMGDDLKLKQAGEDGYRFGRANDSFSWLLIQRLPELYIHFNKLLNGLNSPEVVHDCKTFFEEFNNQLKEELEYSPFRKLLDKEEK